jgi:hypothetical protein
MCVTPSTQLGKGTGPRLSTFHNIAFVDVISYLVVVGYLHVQIATAKLLPRAFTMEEVVHRYPWRLLFFSP